MIKIIKETIQKGSEIILNNQLHLNKNTSGIYIDVVNHIISSNYIYIAYIEDKPVGCSLSSIVSPMMVYVKKDYRRLGIGKTLIMFLMNEKKYSEKEYFMNLDRDGYKNKFWKNVENTKSHLRL